MIINKLNIKEYGKLKDREIILKDGLNIIYGENESGKSTIATALKSFLYKDHSAKKKYKRNYIPKGEKAGFFDVDFTENNEEYKAILELGKTNAKTLMKLTKNGEEQIIEDKEIGEYFFDIGEDFYDSVFYIKDLEAYKNINENSESVHERLSKEEKNITVESNISELLNRAKEEINKYKRKTATGILYPLEEEKRELLSKKLLTDRIYENLEEIKKEKEEIKLKKEEEEKVLKILREKENLVLEYEEYKEKLRQNKIYEKLSEINEKLSVKLPENPEIPKEDLEDIKELSNIKKPKNKSKIYLSLMFLFLAFSGIMYFENPIYLTALILEIPLIILYFKMRKEIKNYNNNYNKLINYYEKYNIKSIEDYYIKLQEYNRINEEQKSAQREKEIILLNSSGEIKKEDIIFDKEVPKETKTEIRFLIEKEKEEINDLNLREVSLKERENSAFNNLPDPMTLDMNLEKIDRELKEKREELSVISDYYEILNITSSNLKSGYIPCLNNNTKNILNKIYKDTDYFALKDNMEFEIRKKDENNIMEFFEQSRGAQDIINFAIRLATVNLVAKDKKIPLILDDPFLNLDDNNFKTLTEYISNNLNTQIIYFTAHKRIFDLPLEKDNVIVLK